jgi:hypothetical protein
MEPCLWYTKALEIHNSLEIPVTGKITLRSSLLPPIHKNPADRIIIATAQLLHLPIVIHDGRFEHYQCTRISIKKPYLFFSRCFRAFITRADDSLYSLLQFSGV